MIKYKITLALILLYTVAISQNYTDALRLSENLYGSTAKSVSMGNSLSAVGADLSVLSTNPAGMAIFKKSELTFSPSLTIDNTESSFLSRSYNESRIGFGMSNLGFVGVFKRKGDWKQFSFGMNYNKITNFKQHISIKGENTGGSILDYYTYNANSPYPDGYDARNSSFREDLAYNTYLISIDKNGTGKYYNDITDEGIYGETQKKVLNRNGYKSEFATSFAANYNDLLMLGATIGIESMIYDHKLLYSESNFADVYRLNQYGESIQVDPEKLEFEEKLSTQGVGANFKFGFLLQPIEFLRFGGAIHSRTYYNLTDAYDTNMEVLYPTANSNGSYTEYADTEVSEFDYKASTPFRVNAGLAFILEAYKIGKYYTLPVTVSFDYDYVDYSKTYYKLYNFGDDYDFDATNDVISEKYGVAHNIRAGLEFELGKVQLRGGYGLYSNPETNKDDFMDGAKMVFSGGIGFVWNGMFLDLGYQNMTSTETIYMYDATTTFPNNPMGNLKEPTADLTKHSHYIHLTLGFRW